MRIRYWIATLFTALLGVCAMLNIAVPDVLQDLWSDDGPAVALTASVATAESDVDQAAPAYDGVAENSLRDEGAPVVRGEREGGIPSTLPLATPEQRGCVWKGVGNFSSREGVRPSMFVLHYTVSANRAGLSDLDAIRSWFNNPASQASSNYIIDFEGNCYFLVSEAEKAWTQGAFNRDSISIEFIATGQEPTSAWGEAGLRKGARVVADAIKRWNIPLRLVNPDGCTVTAGITDHNRLECGNEHTDVEPNFPWTKFMGYVRDASSSCYRYQLRDNGNVIRASDKFRKAGADAALGEFLKSRHDAILTRLSRDDHDASLKRVKVVCG